jgi:FAD/FMN-containing dehydrogenase
MGESDLNGEIGALREGFAGSVLTADDGGYEDARAIFNSMIDRRPAVIAQCESAADVAAAIGFGRERELELAIRSGGHSVAGASLTDGGLVIDMRRMNQVTVDPEAKTATAQGGANWHAFDTATQPHNLMATGDRVSTTGVAGLTLGGGSGWLERKFGLACDNLLSITLVTADGETVTAGEDSNPGCSGLCTAAAATSGSRPSSSSVCMSCSRRRWHCCYGRPTGALKSPARTVT